MQLKLASLGLGTVTYVPEEPARPDQTDTQGNVTVNVVGRPGRDAYWSVTYTINADFEAGDGPQFRMMNWVVHLPATDARNAPYFELEAEAARQIAPMIRAVADAIENEVADYDARKSEAAERNA